MWYIQAWIGQVFLFGHFCIYCERTVIETQEQGHIMSALSYMVHTPQGEPLERPRMCLQCMSCYNSLFFLRMTSMCEHSASESTFLRTLPGNEQIVIQFSSMTWKICPFQELLHEPPHTTQQHNTKLSPLSSCKQWLWKETVSAVVIIRERLQQKRCTRAHAHDAFEDIFISSLFFEVDDTGSGCIRKCSKQGRTLQSWHWTTTPSSGGVAHNSALALSSPPEDFQAKVSAAKSSCREWHP